MQNLKIPNGLWWLFLFLLALPLWFIFMNPGHDWGDDFAQYLLQAGKFSGASSPVSFYPNGYAPAIKGWFFSVMLIPAVIWFPSNEILVSKAIITLFAGISVYPLFLLAVKRLQLTNFTAVAVCGYYLYNFQSLLIKDQIVPEFAFIFFSALALYLATSLELKRVLTGLILALLAVGIKSSGWVLLMLLPVIIFRNGILSRRLWRTVLVMTGILLTGAFFFLPSESGAVWYVQQTLNRISLQTILQQSGIYYHTSPGFFEMEIPMWMNKMIFLTFLSGWLGGTIFGIKKSFKDNSDLSGWLSVFQLLYLLMLVCYPYSGEPYRFLFPILPFALLTSAAFYNRWLPSVLRPFLGWAAFGLMLTTLPGIQKAMKMHPQYGPFTQESRNLFQYLRENVPPHTRLYADKPFAFTYFTGLPFEPISDDVKAGNWSVVSVNRATAFRIPKGALQVYANSDWVVFATQFPVQR